MDGARIDKRLATRYVDERVDDLDGGIDRALGGAGPRRGTLLGVRANAVDLLERLIARGVVPDLLTDQTSAHDELNGYVPHGLPLEDALRSRRPTPRPTAAARSRRWARTCEAMLALKARGAVTFDYGNNLRAGAEKAGVDERVRHRRLRSAVHPAAVLRGQGAVPVGGALGGSRRTSPRPIGPILRLFPENAALRRWITLAGERVAFQGLPARICWLGYGERARAGLAFNELVRDGEVKAPIVIGRDHLDCGSVASPNRETEAMKDGSDAIADWPMLNALLNTASGATWVSFHHGGGVGIGYSLHAGHGRRRGRDREGRGASRARAHDRSRHGRRAPRGRRLSGGARLRRAPRDPIPMAR